MNECHLRKDNLKRKNVFQPPFFEACVSFRGSTVFENDSDSPHQVDQLLMAGKQAYYTG